jgi:hypothetical protein
MKKLWFALIIFSALEAGFSQDLEMKNKIITAVSLYELDSRERVFSNLPGSEEFIKEFQLNPLEVEMIGDWYKFGSTRRNDNEYGAGISITFFPNRVFTARSQNSIHEMGVLKSQEEIIKMGYWKVERGELMIQFKQMYVNTVYPAVMTGKTQKYETPYYGIWRPSLYEEGAVQKTLFYYHHIPENIRVLYDIDLIDHNRQRYLTSVDYTSNLRDDIYTSAKPWYNFLMSPDLEDDTYVLYLRKIVTIHTLGTESFHAYNQLDFSQWN